MKEKIIAMLEAEKYNKPDDWHIISQQEANKRKNFNDGIQKAIEIVQKEM